MSDLAKRSAPDAVVRGELPEGQRTSRSYAQRVRQILRHRHVNAVAIDEKLEAEAIRIVREFMASDNLRRQRAGWKMLMECKEYNLAAAKLEIEAIALAHKTKSADGGGAVTNVIYVGGVTREEIV